MKILSLIAVLLTVLYKFGRKGRKSFSYTQARGTVRMLFIQKTSIITQKRAPEV